MNKDDLVHICMHPHIAFSSIPYLPCSTFFPHTKVANACSVYFHPQLYILFSVLSNYSSDFLTVHPGWLSASEMPLLLLRLGSSAWGAAFSDPGYDAVKDKLNRRKRIYIFMTVPILLGKGKNRETENCGRRSWKGTDILIKPRPDSRVHLLMTQDFFLDTNKSDCICPQLWHIYDAALKFSPGNREVTPHKVACLG